MYQGFTIHQAYLKVLFFAYISYYIKILFCIGYTKGVSK
jgi:hypothetical protein